MYNFINCSNMNTLWEEWKVTSPFVSFIIHSWYDKNISHLLDWVLWLDIGLINALCFYQAAFEKVREMVKKHMRRYESGICIADCHTPFGPLENGCNEKILAWALQIVIRFFLKMRLLCRRNAYHNLGCLCQFIFLIASLDYAL